MKHIKQISVVKAQDDTFGYIFLQIWLSVFTAIISGAFSNKD